MVTPSAAEWIKSEPAGIGTEPLILELEPRKLMGKGVLAKAPEVKTLIHTQQQQQDGLIPSFLCLVRSRSRALINRLSGCLLRHSSFLWPHCLLAEGLWVASIILLNPMGLIVKQKKSTLRGS